MKSRALFFPPPGLDGTYRGSCVVCLRGTDTAMGISGPAEAFVGVLSACFGIDKEEAGNTIGVAYGCDPGMVPCGDGPWIVRLCSACAKKSKPGPLPVGLLPDEIPVISLDG